MTFLLGCALWLFHVGTGLAFGETNAIAELLSTFVADQIRAFALLLAFVVADRVTAWVINDRRRAARASARMHSTELERIVAEKGSIESDLQAMQARVEPQFLFNTLAQVKRLYEQDRALGEHMLDGLIAYLRAAMPKMRDTSSTVGQEIELVRAYLAIVKVRLGDRFTYEIESSPAANATRMSPMMLLPLVDHVLARGPTESVRNESTPRSRTKTCCSSSATAVLNSGWTTKATRSSPSASVWLRSMATALRSIRPKPATSAPTQC